MVIGDMARPKGSIHPFRPIICEDSGMYALRWELRGAMTGRLMDHVAWYEPDELETMKGDEGRYETLRVIGCD